MIIFQNKSGPWSPYVYGVIIMPKHCKHVESPWSLYVYGVIIMPKHCNYVECVFANAQSHSNVMRNIEIIIKYREQKACTVTCTNSVWSELVVLKTQAHNIQHITSKTTLNHWQTLLSWQWVGSGYLEPFHEYKRKALPSIVRLALARTAGSLPWTT